MAAGLPPSDPVVPVLSDQPCSRRGTGCFSSEDRSILITLGEHGMLLFQSGSQPYLTPTRAKMYSTFPAPAIRRFRVFNPGSCRRSHSRRSRPELAKTAPAGIVSGQV